MGSITRQSVINAYENCTYPDQPAHVLSHQSVHIFHFEINRVQLFILYNPVHILMFNNAHYFKIQCTVELQWLKHLWDDENLFKTGKFELMIVNNSVRSGGIIGISFRFSSTERYVVCSHCEQTIYHFQYKQEGHHGPESLT